VLDIRSAACDLVQGAQRQAAARQVAVDNPNAERERRPCGLCRPPDMAMLALSAAERAAVV